MRLTFAVIIAILLCTPGIAQHKPIPLAKASDYNFFQEILRTKQSLPVTKSVKRIIVGKTNFDIQTHGSERIRLIDLNQTSMDGVWTEDQTHDFQFKSRGTGYERYSGEAVLSITHGRIENGTRTGFPSILLLADSNEVVINHADGGYLHMLKRNAYSAGAWSESSIPHDSTIGDLLWPMATVGGNDTMSIHVIALTEPTTAGGKVYNGLDGALLYFRSLDGGASWDIIDTLLPGLNNANYNGFEADHYSITARDSIIAIGVFGVTEDVVVYKSVDNGNTWTTTIVNDFPFTKYVADQKYGTDINGDHIPDTVVTSDGAGSLLITKNGIVHVWFGELRIIDKDLTDGLIKYFPTSSGLHYWNESFGVDSSIVIANLIDLNSSGTFDFLPNIANYNVSLTSFPSSCEAIANQIHVFYSALVENESWNGQQYRHVYDISSEDGGTTWNTPIDLSVAYGYLESVFPSAVKYIDTLLFITIQEDVLPGLATLGDLDPLTTNNEIFLMLDTTELVGLSEKKLQSGSIRLYPNPAESFISIVLPVNMPTAHVELMDLNGRLVEHYENIHSGTSLPMQHIPTGLYLLKATYQGRTLVTKLIKQ